MSTLHYGTVQYRLCMLIVCDPLDFVKQKVKIARELCVSKAKHYARI